MTQMVALMSYYIPQPWRKQHPLLPDQVPFGVAAGSRRCMCLPLLQAWVRRAVIYFSEAAEEREAVMRHGVAD